MPAENVVTLTIRGTNAYLISTTTGFALFDCGFAHDFGAFQHALKRLDIAITQIHWLMISHNDPDHAGMAQAIKRASGAKLLLHEMQAPALAHMRPYGSNSAERAAFEALLLEPGDVLLPAGNRAAMAQAGLRGELLSTPIHSPDSVSLLLDSGLVFTGDLPPGAYDASALETWRGLAALGARQVYPGHGPQNPIEAMVKEVTP